MRLVVFSSLPMDMVLQTFSVVIAALPEKEKEMKKKKKHSVSAH